MADHTTQDKTFGTASDERGLPDLAELLKEPLTFDRLKSWVAADVSLHEPFLKDRVFGKIRWKKAIGRSLGPTLASGFAGAVLCHYLNWRVGPDGVPEFIGKWVQVTPEPDFWDLPDDGDFFQVGYGFWGVRPWMNRVILDFAEKQPWDSPLQLRVRRTVRRIISVPDFYFGEAHYAVLEDATVVEVPIRYF